MKNLAGDRSCDGEIRKELQQAGVEIVQHPEPLRNEVPASVTGKLGNFTFVRAWYYWMVSGDVPLEVAKVMYESPVGKRDVRVAGHCGCPPPEERAFPREEELRKALAEKGIESITYGELAAMCNSGEIQAPRYVSSYHIDSQEGLDLFVATLGQHAIV